MEILKSDTTGFFIQISIRQRKHDSLDSKFCKTKL